MKIILLTSAVFYNSADAKPRVVYSSTSSSSGSSWGGGGSIRGGSSDTWTPLGPAPGGRGSLAPQYRCPSTQVYDECHQAPSAQKNCNTPKFIQSMTACYAGCGCPTGLILRNEGSAECIHESACATGGGGGGGFIPGVLGPEYQKDSRGRNYFLQAAAKGDIADMKNWNSRYPEMKTSRDNSGMTALMIVEESGNAAAFNYVSGIMTVVSYPAQPTWVNRNPASWQETQYGVPASMSEHLNPGARGWGPNGYNGFPINGKKKK